VAERTSLLSRPGVSGVAQNPAVPFGVPSPFGPSHPPAPVHSVVPQVAVWPLVTSLSDDVWP